MRDMDGRRVRGGGCEGERERDANVEEVGAAKKRRGEGRR